MACIQERLVIKSGLWLRAYGNSKLMTLTARGGLWNFWAILALCALCHRWTFFFLSHSHFPYFFSWYFIVQYTDYGQAILQRIYYSIGQMGLEMRWFPLSNGVCLIMKKALSDSPIWQLKKRELLLPLSFLITKPLKLDLHYGPHYKPHYRTQGCVIKENNITTPLWTPLRTPLRTL